MRKWWPQGYWGIATLPLSPFINFAALGNGTLADAAASALIQIAIISVMTRAHHYVKDIRFLEIPS